MDISCHRESQSNSACFTDTDLGNPEAGGLGIKVPVDSNGFMVSKAQASAVIFGKFLVTVDKMLSKCVVKQSIHETD